jgi:IS605 OrfB family transposase
MVLSGSLRQAQGKVSLTPRFNGVVEGRNWGGNLFPTVSRTETAEAVTTTRPPRPIRPIRPTRRTKLRFNPRPAQARKAPKMFSPCVWVGATISQKSTTSNLGMNRIYQGKVTAVEIPEGKDWKKLNDGNWRTVLWRHHELFQDAVNYYTLALAAMAGGFGRDDPKSRENEIKQLDNKLESLVERTKKAKKAKDEAALEDVAKQKQQAETTKDRLQREEAVWQWREQVSKAFKEGVKRKGQTILWETETFARVLKKLEPGFTAVNDFEACCETILKPSKASPQLRSSALLRLLTLAAKKKGEASAALTPLCTDKIVWFCSAPEDLDATDDVEKSAAEKAAWEFSKQLDVAKDNELEALAAKLKPAVFMTRERGEVLKGKDAISALLSYFKQLQQNSPGLKAARATVAQKIRMIRAIEKNEEASMPFTFQLPKARVGLDYKAAKVFKVIPHAALAAVFRKQTETLAKKKTVEVLDCDPLKDARTKANQPQFDYFSNLAFIAAAKADKKQTKKRRVIIDENEDDDSDENRANWFEFDLLAFVEALKSPHRYLQDTVKRREECDRLQKRLDAMRGGGEEESGEGDDESSEKLSGFKGDYRIGLPGDADSVKKGVFQLIHDEELLAYREEDESSETEDEEPDSVQCPACGGRCHGYGINQNTVRGWRELRQKWREAATKPEFSGEANQKKLLDDLARIRREEQGDRPEESGSGPLFKRLELPQYHCIWNDKPPNPSNAEDPLWEWVRYRELHDKLEKTKKAIRFTPAHAVESPRFFIFPKQNRKKSTAPKRGDATAGRRTDHLPGMFGFNDEKKLVEVKGDEAWLKDRPRFMAVYAGLILGEYPKLQPRPVRIIFSAPRLRRDRIRADDENSLGSVSLLQPMMEALGVAREELPEINFANCPMTLLAERRKRPDELAEDESDEEQKKPDCYDLNLSFPVTLEESTLKEHKLFQHAKRWTLQSYRKANAKIERHAQFQFSGDDEMREIAIRWPVDREHSPRKSDEAPAWYETMNRFSCLSVDLGQREGGAYALLDARANGDFGKNKGGKPVASRFIGQTGEKKWRAALAASGMLKLPGEDKRVFRPKTLASHAKPSPDDRNPEDAIHGKKFREELWGDAGRPPLRSTDPGALIDETEQARGLLGKDGFDQLDIMPPGWDKRRGNGNWSEPNTELSFPEQNDKLIVAARRYLSRIRRLHRWCAFLNSENWREKPEKAKQKRERALQEIREACGLDENSVAKHDEEANAPLKEEAWLAPSVKRFVESGADDSGLTEVLKTLLELMLAKLSEQFVIMANRCAPLRGRSWRWTKHAKSTDANPLRILLPTGNAKPNALMKMPDGTERKVTWIRGQRGFSMKRIAQLEDLRRLFQSLNQIQRRKIGTMPPCRKRGEKGDELPDCCPKLLEKLDELKEQRVNQTAHQVLALALGLRLKKSGPTKSETERKHSDIHGEYERVPDASQPEGFRHPVDFIVIEDLKYYETTRVRSRRENVRLMRWCRRHFRDKLKQLCDVFGFPVVEANPANTSKFCARTGVAGFRAVEVGPGFHEEYVWRKALEKLDKYRKDKKKNPLKPDDLAFCEGAEKLKQQVEKAQKIPTKSGNSLPCPRTLLAPLGSGNVFVPIVGAMDGTDLPPAVVQADVNAAVMLGLRAMADPQLWEIHPRLRTKPPEKEKKSKRGKKGEPEAPRKNPDEKRFPPDLFAAEKRKFGEKTIKLDLTNASEDGAIKDSRKPNFFCDLAGLAHWDKTVIPDPKTDRPISLPSGKALWSAVKAAQWKRVDELNQARIVAWQNKANAMPD